MNLGEGARAMLAERLGRATGQDARREAPAGAHPALAPARAPLIDRSPEARLPVAWGESYADWIRKRLGHLPPVPDGVAFVESGEQVRALLAWRTRSAGSHSVCGRHQRVGPPGLPRGRAAGAVPALGRLNRLLHLDATSQLATFGAGTPGPLVEAQLRAQGYTLGHFPQSFEYSTVGGWVVTRPAASSRCATGASSSFCRRPHGTPVGRSPCPPARLQRRAGPARDRARQRRALGVLTEATVRVSPLPEHESFHALFLPDWDAAEAAVRALVQERLPLSMLRLSNGIETETNLRLAGHERQIALLERYLGWRGCGQGKCLLTLGVTAAPPPRATPCAPRARCWHGMARCTSGRPWAANGRPTASRAPTCATPCGSWATAWTPSRPPWTGPRSSR
jgi:alkyldihydroxyacetonephosphate synthase